MTKVATDSKSVKGSNNVADTAAHARNFLDCVKSRKETHCPVETGHRSTIAAHLGNIAYRTGRKLRWDAAREEIIDDPAASALLGRTARKPWDLI